MAPEKSAMEAWMSKHGPTLEKALGDALTSAASAQSENPLDWVAESLTTQSNRSPGEQNTPRSSCRGPQSSRLGDGGYGDRVARS